MLLRDSRGASLSKVIMMVGGGDLHIPETSLSANYDILTTLHQGTMGKVYLAAWAGGSCSGGGGGGGSGSGVAGGGGCEEVVALKAVHRDVVKRRQVLREYHYASSLLHPNIAHTTGPLFQTDLYLVYPLEHARLGDLGSLLRSRSLEEGPVKWIGEQVASALCYIHSHGLVHGNICPENLLIFRKDLSVVKVTDFGSSCRIGTFMKRQTRSTAYTPPELARLATGEGFYTSLAQDTWALGVLLINCLHGSPPWASTDLNDPDYSNFRDWQKRKSTRVPRLCRRFTVRLLRLLRRLLEPKGYSRYEAKEVFKYLDDDWVIKARGRSGSNDLEGEEWHASPSDCLLEAAVRAALPISTPSKMVGSSPSVASVPSVPPRVASPRRFLTDLLKSHGFNSPSPDRGRIGRVHAWLHGMSSTSSSSSSSSSSATTTSLSMGSVG
ncbi:serine/threonine-protein kinase SBK1-like [Oratosquilla oratoria]|uniref:serine/threonine-protein kinase SBK1-like n=1 Tax=Oratosquilla oratoria TaxID=337810 RepID=UPI003F76A155